MSVEPYLRYLWTKFQPIYGLREEAVAKVGV